ncbi:MAG: hypothetical protein ABIU77_27315 [Ferruginibacter sp.]
MLNTTKVAKVYDTIFNIPGMNETMKLSVQISRKNILLLNGVIEKGLKEKEGDKAGSLMDIFPKESLQELNAFSEDCLKKAGLLEFNEKLSITKCKIKSQVILTTMQPIPFSQIKYGYLPSYPFW